MKVFDKTEEEEEEEEEIEGSEEEENVPKHKRLTYLMLSSLILVVLAAVVVFAVLLLTRDKKMEIGTEGLDEYDAIPPSYKEQESNEVKLTTEKQEGKIETSSVEIKKVNHEISRNEPPFSSYLPGKLFDSAVVGRDNYLRFFGVPNISKRKDNLATIEAEVELPTRVLIYENKLNGQLEIVPEDSSAVLRPREGFAHARILCTKMNADIVTVETEEDLEEIYNATMEFQLLEAMRSPIVFLGLRLKLNDWISRDGSTRIYNGLVSSMWHQSYSEESIIDDEGCAVLQNKEETRLFSPYSCKATVPCFACQNQPEETETCDFNICYKLFIADVTSEEAEEICNARQSSLATPSSFPMLDKLITEVENHDLENACNYVAIGFVRDFPLEDINGYSIRIQLQPYTENRTKLSDSCIGFDILYSKKFTRASCSTPSGAVCRKRFDYT